MSASTDQVKVDVKPDLLTSKSAKIEIDKLSQRTKADESKTLKYKLEGKYMVFSLFRWKNTVLPKVLTKFDVWAGMIFHCTLFAIDRAYNTDTPSGFKTVATLGVNSTFTSDTQFSYVTFATGYIGQCNWLMVFTLTFFLNQCYARYNKFYGGCMGMGGKLLEISQKLAVDFESLPEERWLTVRYLIASTEFVFGDTQRGKGRADVHKELFWKRLREPESNFLGHPVKNGEGKEIACPPLLTEEEIAVLKEYNGNRLVLLQTWAYKAAATGYEKIGVSRAFLPIRDDITAIRQAGAGILNTLNLPVPFPYYHILLVITIVNYFLFGLAFLEMKSYLSPFIMLIVVMMFTGMRELAVELADPFGDDEQDFPVMKYMTNMRSGASPLVIDTTWYPTAVKSETKDVKKIVMSTFALPPPS